jgi:uncharacterized membrane protein YdjX (TVP38/TMEM64 family)
MSLSPDIHLLHPAKPGIDSSAAQLAIIQIQLKLEDLRNQRKDLTYCPSRSLVFLGWLRNIFILLGSIVTIIGIAIFRTKIGFIMFLFGIALFIILYFIVKTLKRATAEEKQRWEGTSGKTIQSLDEEITRKIIELDTFQGIVAGK